MAYLVVGISRGFPGYATIKPPVVMINVNEVHPDKDYQGMPENMFTNLENPKIQVFSIEPSFVSIYICVCIYIAMHEKSTTC